MKWLDFCIQNKLIVYVAIIALVASGLFCLYKRPVTPFPASQGNDITISISYPGANAQTVERQVTTKLVMGLLSIKNLRYIHADSQSGSSKIVLVINAVAPENLLQTQIHIMQVIAAVQLPVSVPLPKIHISHSSSGLMQFMVSSNKLDLFSIDNFISSKLAAKFNTLPGVSIDKNNLDPVVKIALNPEALIKYHLTLSMVLDTIKQNYQPSPLGNLYINHQRYILNIADNFDSLTALRNLVIAYQHSKNLRKNSPSMQLGVPVYLRDIANITFSPRNSADMPYSTFNGKIADAIGLETSAAANPFWVSKEARAYVDSLKKNLPSDISITPVFDMSKVMMMSIEEISFTILISSILVLLVALIFLGYFRTTLIPIITIPVCLLGSIIFITWAGYSLNLIVLLAMVVAVGLVVDDAIVVIENITHYVEQGVEKTQAILKGTTGIFTTIIGITLTLLAVYLPILFSKSEVSTLLKPFVLTLASAVLISGVVALTLTPVMSLKLINIGAATRYQRWFSNLLFRVIECYQMALQKFLKSPKKTLLLMLVLLAVSIFFSLKLPKMVFPPDPSNRVAIVMQGAPADTIQSLKKKLSAFSTFYKNDTVDYYSTSIHKNHISGLLDATINIQYKSEYLTRNMKFVDRMNNFISSKHIPNTLAKMHSFTTWGGSFDVSFYVYSDEASNKTNLSVKKLIRLMRSSDLFSMINNNMALPNKQLAFSIDSVHAAAVGISREQIIQLLSNYYGGVTLNDSFNIAGLSVPVVIELNGSDLKDARSFEKLQVQSDLNNHYYPLSDFVTVKIIAKPSRITTFNNYSAVRIDANLNKGYTIADAIKSINRWTQDDTPQLQLQYIDNAHQYEEGNNETIIILLLGIISVYLLLTILFKNLLDPFIIMLTAPFSVFGGALSLYLVNGSLNIYSILGLITLIGLITKHGVLIIKFANAELDRGNKVLDAILLATHRRFRPIMMTTLAMIFGVLPLVLSDQVMYVARRNLGITIIGGLIIGTFFSLFIVPLMYILMKKPFSS